MGPIKDAAWTRAGWRKVEEDGEKEIDDCRCRLFPTPRLGIRPSLSTSSTTSESLLQSSLCYLQNRRVDAAAVMTMSLVCHEFTRDYSMPDLPYSEGT